MKIVIHNRPVYEHATLIESFVRDFQHRYESAKKIEMVSVDTKDGASTASIYDIWSYPAILVLADDGSVMNSWQGEPLPLMDEVAGYAHGN